MNIRNHIIGKRRTKSYHEHRANLLGPLEFMNQSDHLSFQIKSSREMMYYYNMKINIESSDMNYVKYPSFSARLIDGILFRLRV